MNFESSGLLQGFETDVKQPVFRPELLIADSCRWYAVCTRSRHEKLVHDILGEKGVHSFLPLRGVLSQWKDRRKWVQKPLFPGYLFVRSEKKDFSLVSATRGVAYIVGNGVDAVAVPDEQVEAIVSLTQGPYPVTNWPLLEKGKRVRIIAGPLAGLETYIVERRGTTKCLLVVTVDLLGRSVAVEIDGGCVEPIC